MVPLESGTMLYSATTEVVPAWVEGAQLVLFKIHHCQSLDMVRPPSVVSRLMSRLMNCGAFRQQSAVQHQKETEVSRQENTWTCLKCMLLSQRSQFEKAIYCMISTMWHCGHSKKVLETIEGPGATQRKEDEWA